MFICKVCTVFYGNKPEPVHGWKGPWSHRGVLFKDNPGEKMWWHKGSDDHKDAIHAKSNMKIEESISAFRTEDRSNANELYITNLINWPVKFMFQNFY